jgi:hypothetical protein
MSKSATTSVKTSPTTGNPYQYANDGRVILQPEFTVDEVIDLLSEGLTDKATFVAWQSDKDAAQAARMAKPCPLTKDEFLAQAKEWGVDFGDGQIIKAKPMAFSSGSFGWNLNGKASVMVGGVPVKVQLSGNFVAIGSKPAK